MKIELIIDKISIDLGRDGEVGDSFTEFGDNFTNMRSVTQKKQPIPTKSPMKLCSL
jgi:hypothetical protein